MERKGMNGTAAVAIEGGQVKRALGSNATLGSLGSLGSDEERVLRMRHGAPVDLSAPLPRAAGRNAELADELTLIEMQLLRAMRAHGREPGPRHGLLQIPPAPVATQSRTKDKIVRALRKKR